MKFMEKAKRFFTLSAKHEGFTLVELIVVIAILAILAGVAIPAYSGYIKKSQEAADNTLLVAVNRAFASACLENGTDAILIPDGQANIGVVDGKVVFNQPEEFRDAFYQFYDANQEATFKVYQSLYFANGAFHGSYEAGQAVNVGGKTYYVNQNSVNNFKGSIFYENKESMQEDLGTLSGAFGDLAGDKTAAELGEMFGGDYAEYLKDAGATDANSIGNATVMYVAGQTAGMTAQNIGDALLAAQNALSQDNASIYDLEDPLTTSAMMYGAITAYANGAGKDSALADALANGVTGQSDLLSLFNTASKDPGFLSYVGTVDGGKLTVGSQFEQDMNGYLGAMDAMNTVSGGVDVNTSDLWNSADINNLLNSLG